MAIIARICTLERTAAGNPKLSQFPDVDIGSVLGLGFSIGYGGPKPRPCYPILGFNPRYLAWHHSNIDANTGLYALFFGPGPGGTRRDWVEAAPRNGLRGYPYCEQETHLWRWFRCSGWDNTDPENPVWIQEQMYAFGQQPPPPSEVSESTPWETGNYSIVELVPSIPYTIAGFDLPAYSSAYDDETNGDEI
jgi:hypothetical protein